mmetsp:Transcript_15084/g.33271  ORF Transcript_15084/g.33271 Transcript_15084/m.33271 type:complete len:218 (-) Transcript_15084:1522-2175(-)
MRIASKRPEYLSWSRVMGASNEPAACSLLGFTQRMKCGSVELRVVRRLISCALNWPPRVDFEDCLRWLGSASAVCLNSCWTSSLALLSITSLAVSDKLSLFLSRNPPTVYCTAPAKWHTEKHSGRVLFFTKYLLHVLLLEPKVLSILAIYDRSDAFPSEHSSSSSASNPYGLPSMRLTHSPLSSNCTDSVGTPSYAYIADSSLNITWLKWNCSFSLA